MSIRAIGACDLTFEGKPKKKLKKSIARKALLIGAIGTAALVYHTQKGNGGKFDRYLDDCRPMTRQCGKTVKDFFNKFKK